MSCGSGGGQPYRDYRKKDMSKSAASSVTATTAAGSATKRAVGRVARFGVTSFTSIRSSSSSAALSCSNSGGISLSSSAATASALSANNHSAVSKNNNNNNGHFASHGDAYSFKDDTSDSPAFAGGTSQNKRPASPPKPRRNKFFKSRNQIPIEEPCSRLPGSVSDNVQRPVVKVNMSKPDVDVQSNTFNDSCQRQQPPSSSPSPQQPLLVPPLRISISSLTSSFKQTSSTSVPSPLSSASSSSSTSAQSSRSSAPCSPLQSASDYSPWSPNSTPSEEKRENLVAEAEDSVISATSQSDDPPSSFGASLRAPIRSYARKKSSTSQSEKDITNVTDAKQNETRADEPHVEYENPHLRKSDDILPLAIPSSASCEGSAVVSVKPVANLPGSSSSAAGRKTFFKNKHKTDPATAKAKAVSRYKFNFTGEDELPLGGSSDFSNSLSDVSSKRAENDPSSKKSPFNDDFSQPTSPQVVSYAKVRNVKKAYEVHEIGEAQEFNDDVEYLLESVTDSNSLATRCLSVCSLASKCMSAQFRVHLRAHGVMTKFFELVADAPKHPSLALCVSALFFVLSQDRLTMDLEASTLAILLQLFESGEKIEAGKHAEKVFQLCTQMRHKGHAKHLDMQRVSASSLALETLLSLTSRRAGEWFKEELRVQGGLTHLAELIMQSMQALEAPDWGVLDEPRLEQLDLLKKIERVLRVLENVTFVNTGNQDYLIRFRGGVILDSFANLFNLCYENIDFHQVMLSLPEDMMNQSISLALQKADGPGPVFLSVLLSLLKVMLNVTHENGNSSDNWGSRGRTMRQLLECLLYLPTSIDIELRFDLQLLCLGLCINISEHSIIFREWMLTSTVRVSCFAESGVPWKKHNALAALVQIFRDRQIAATTSENQTDEILNSQEEKVKQQEMKKLEDYDGVSKSDHTGDVGSLSSQHQLDKEAADDLEETIRNVIQKAGKHMEHSIISAYVALLLGCIIQGHEQRTTLLKELAGGSLTVFAEALRKFTDFVDNTGVLGQSAFQSIERILGVLETS